MEDVEKETVCDRQTDGQDKIKVTKKGMGFTMTSSIQTIPSLNTVNPV